MTDIHIVFGSELLAKRYSQTMAVHPQKIMLATRPEQLTNLRITKLYVVRYTKDAWEPPSHPCAERVRQTEAEIKKLMRLGAEVIDRHFG